MHKSIKKRYSDNICKKINDFIGEIIQLYRGNLKWGWINICQIGCISHSINSMY